MCEALLRRPPSKPFHALEHLFLLCRGCSAFWPARFSTSSRPIVIFRLISLRLVLHDRFFFHLCLLSFSVLSSKERLHIRLVLLGNPCKTYQHQSVGKRWNECPFSLPAEQLAHLNMYTQQVLTITFGKFWQNIGLHCEGALRSTMKVQRLPPSARRHAQQDLVTMESVLF